MITLKRNTLDQTEIDYNSVSKNCRIPFQDNDLSSTISTRQSSTCVNLQSEMKEYFPTVCIRDSIQLVHDDVYDTCAELDGEGFSYREMQIAILIVVGNRIFKQSWTIPKEKDRESKYDVESEETRTVFDPNTLPTRKCDT